MMAIKPLPEVTVRLLGSTQALTTPVSLVKELVENALDAKATSIDIMISQNTLDRIEVRDNGHGIPQEDLNSLGKRGYTSKLRSYDELRTIGGASLGFRGEALYSAVQLGQVSVTSKCYGEDIATTVKLSPLGGVDLKKTTSHPIGTTISVANFLHSLPVRKQTSLKEASKTLGKIKELLRAHCLARLHVKFSLKLIKGAKGSWSFSPRPADGIREVVSQAISREVANNCIERSLTFLSDASHHATENGYNPNADGIEEINSACNKFHVEMFLPKPGIDFSIVSHGQYFSIDSRPVSHEKGLMKKIVTIFKHCLKGSLSASTSKISNPFLRLSITCPSESYDPNIEPAKDDVIFDNESMILKNIEEAFENVYGESRFKRSCPEPAFQGIIDDNNPLPIQESSRETRVPDALSSNSNLINGAPLHVSPIISATELDNENHLQKKIERDTYSKKCDPRNLETPTKLKGSCYNLSLIRTPESAPRRPENLPLNPWLIAKMSSSKQVKSNEDHNFLGSKSSQNLLPTPQLSLDSFMVNFNIHSSLDKGRIIERSSKETTMAKASRQMLLPVSQPSPSKGRSQNINSDDDLILPERTNKTNHRDQEFVSARHMIISETSSPTQLLNAKRQKTINKPFVLPLKEKKNIQLETLHHITPRGQKTVRKDDSGSNHESIEEAEPNADLSWSMDYENRKAEATRKLREKLRAAQPNEDSLFCSPPCKGRQDKVVPNHDINLTQVKDIRPKSLSKIETTLSDSDPRGYFVRRQNSLLSRVGKPDGSKISRIKSQRLPLEQIPGDQELHHLMIRVKTSLGAVKNMDQCCEDSDEYIQRGSARENLEWGFNLKKEDKEILISVVKRMVESQGSYITPKNKQAEYHFENLITAHSNIPN